MESNCFTSNLFEPLLRLYFLLRLFPASIEIASFPIFFKAFPRVRVGSQTVRVLDGRCFLPAAWRHVS